MWLIVGFTELNFLFLAQLTHLISAWEPHLSCHTHLDSSDDGQHPFCPPWAPERLTPITVLLPGLALGAGVYVRAMRRLIDARPGCKLAPSLTDSLWPLDGHSIHYFLFTFGVSLSFWLSTCSISHWEPILLLSNGSVGSGSRIFATSADSCTFVKVLSVLPPLHWSLMRCQLARSSSFIGCFNKVHFACMCHKFATGAQLIINPRWFGVRLSASIASSDKTLAISPIAIMIAGIPISLQDQHNRQQWVVTTFDDFPKLLSFFCSHKTST